MSSNFDMEKYNLMLNCLKNTFCFTDQKTRNKSEETLKELAEDTINHILMIVKCLKNDSEIPSKKTCYLLLLM